MTSTTHHVCSHTASALSLSALLLLSACAGPTPEEKQAVADAKPLSGSQISTVISGNTLSGVDRKGASWIEYYDPSGQIRGLWKGNDKYSSTWKVDGDKFCGDYEGSDDDFCAPLSMNGDQIYYIEDNGGAYNVGRPAMLASGNTSNL
jgi:hypothetical protein